MVNKMGKFKEFLSEENTEITIEDIKSFLDDLNDEDIDSLGAVIFDEFFSSEEDTSDDLTFDTNDVLDMVKQLGKDMYEYILDLIMPDDQETDDIEDEDEEMDENVSRAMQTKNINRKKRKFMRKSIAQLRKEAPKRKIENRKTFAKRKRYARANAAKIAQYKKSREKFIKKGVHHVKLRKKSGITA